MTPYAALLARAFCIWFVKATGNTDSVTQGLQACRKAATFVEFSVFTKPATIDWTVIGDTKSLTIKGGRKFGALPTSEESRVIHASILSNISRLLCALVILACSLLKIAPVTGAISWHLKCLGLGLCL